MRRKTSALPTKVYKYALKPPTLGADVADEQFCEARVYYNQLVTIENRRRYLFRRSRTEIFPEYAAAEEEVSRLELSLAESRRAVSAEKAAARTRKVDPSAGDDVKVALAELKRARQALSALAAPIRLADHQLVLAGLEAKHAEAESEGRGLEAQRLSDSIVKLRMKITKEAQKTSLSDEVREKILVLRAQASQHGAEANMAVKALRARKTLYWGSYLLAEAAAHQASVKSDRDVAYDETPAHLLRSRIGVHWCKGITVADLNSGDDTLMQFVDPPVRRQSKSGIWRYRHQRDGENNVVHCKVRFRVGSVGRGKDPLWVEFPCSYDRPLPDDGIVKDAYIVRQPLRERNPWQYHLCVVVEASSFESTSRTSAQVGTAAVNFGWRQMRDGGIRVATISREGDVPRHVVLPPRYVTSFDKCESLRALVDQKFDVVKREIASFVQSRLGRQFSASDRLPEAFAETFEHVLAWRSPHRLCELARYWENHRVPGDAGIYSIVQDWRATYLHLHDWETNQRRHSLRWRKDLYARVAKHLVTTCERLVVDTFCIADVARRPSAEVALEGGDSSRRNRQLASPGDLREAIMRAARKYHCEVVAAPTTDGTRRCNACGVVYDWDPAVAVDHACAGADCGAVWDQDVNNTDNLHDALASGVVVPLVRPATISKNGEVCQSEQLPYQVARELLGK